MNVLRALLTDKRFRNERYLSTTADRSLAAELRKKTFDIIHLEGLPVTAYLPTIRKNSKAKVIFRPHNTGYEVWKRMAQQVTDCAMRSVMTEPLAQALNDTLEGDFAPSSLFLGWPAA